MNFTSDVKREIISRGIAGAAAERAALSAFLRTSGALGVKDGKRAFFIVSETENVAEFFGELFEKVFSEPLSVSRAFADRMSGRSKLVLEYQGLDSERILSGLGLLGKDGGFYPGISEELIPDKQAAVAYIKGAFLGGGSCILPVGKGKTGYHLEFVFPDRRTAEDFCDLLADSELIAKALDRGGNTVAYVKSKETISDFLAVTGAENSLRKFSSLVEKRDEANRNNRAANCFSGNADKAATAAVKQMLAIGKLSGSGRADGLSDDLKALAKARAENPALSLRELAEKLGVSKSCLNHRMRKLMEIADEASETEKIGERTGRIPLCAKEKEKK